MGLKEADHVAASAGLSVRAPTSIPSLMGAIKLVLLEGLQQASYLVRSEKTGENFGAGFQLLIKQLKNGFNVSKHPPYSITSSRNVFVFLLFPDLFRLNPGILLRVRLKNNDLLLPHIVICGAVIMHTLKE